MLDEKQRKIADKYGWADKIGRFQENLLKVQYIEDVVFDLSDLCEPRIIKYITFITKYDIPLSVDNYYKLRLNMTNEILQAINKSGFKKTQDKIEDYGEHLYFVVKTII